MSKIKLIASESYGKLSEWKYFYMYIHVAKSIFVEIFLFSVTENISTTFKQPFPIHLCVDYNVYEHC